MRNISVPSLLLLRPLIQSRLPFIWSSVSLGTDLQQRGIMASYTRFLLVCLAYLALGAQAFLASPGVITRRYACSFHRNAAALQDGTINRLFLWSNCLASNDTECTSTRKAAQVLNVTRSWGDRRVKGRLISKLDSNDRGIRKRTL